MQNINAKYQWKTTTKVLVLFSFSLIEGSPSLHTGINP
jgi:hypothetical protein